MGGKGATKGNYAAYRSFRSSEAHVSFLANNRTIDTTLVTPYSPWGLNSTLTYNNVFVKRCLTGQSASGDYLTDSPTHPPTHPSLICYTLPLPSLHPPSNTTALALPSYHVTPSRSITFPLTHYPSCTILYHLRRGLSHLATHVAAHCALWTTLGRPHLSQRAAEFCPLAPLQSALATPLAQTHLAALTPPLQVPAPMHV